MLAGGYLLYYKIYIVFRDGNHNVDHYAFCFFTHFHLVDYNTVPLSRLFVVHCSFAWYMLP